VRWAEHDAEKTGEPARRFTDFRWTTRDSWSRRRWVVAKAKWMPDRGANSANPRFVVTSLKADAWKTQPLYERLYCARGSPPRSADRVSFGERVAALLLRDGKPHQGVPARSLRRPQGPHAACCVGWLHQRQDNARQSMARRPSIRSLKGTRPAGRGGQLRLWLALMAYVLLTALRRIGLAHTDLAKATCGTIRLRLLKIGAVVTKSVRRIKIAMSSACPNAAEFRLAHARLSR
jgi:hypothetical protein